MCQCVCVNVVCVAEGFCVVVVVAVVVVESRSHYLRQNSSSGLSLPSTSVTGVSHHTLFMYLWSLAVSALQG